MANPLNKESYSESDTKICFWKDDLLKAFQNKRVEVRLECSKSSAKVKGFLRFDEKTEVWFVQQSRTKDTVMTFTTEALFDVLITQDILIVMG